MSSRQPRRGGGRPPVQSITLPLRGDRMNSTNNTDSTNSMNSTATTDSTNSTANNAGRSWATVARGNAALPTQPALPVQPTLPEQPMPLNQPALPTQPALPVKPTLPDQPMPLNQPTPSDLPEQTDASNLSTTAGQVSAPGDASLLVEATSSTQGDTPVQSNTPTQGVTSTQSITLTQAHTSPQGTPPAQANSPGQDSAAAEAVPSIQGNAPVQSGTPGQGSAPTQDSTPGQNTVPGHGTAPRPAHTTTQASAPVQTNTGLQISTAPKAATAAHPGQAQQAAHQHLIRSAGRIVTNHFEILSNALNDFYEYTLNVLQNNPAPGPNQTIPRRVRRRVVYLFINRLRLQPFNLPRPASDYYGYLLSVGAIPANFINVPHNVAYYEDWQAAAPANPMTFTVTIGNQVLLSLNQMRLFLTNPAHPSFFNQGVNTFPATRDRIIRALNIVFSNRANLITFKDRPSARPQGNSQVGSNRFYELLPVGTPDAQGGQTGPWHIDQSIYALPGYFLSTRAHSSPNGNIFLNVNTTTSAFFRPQNLDTLIRQLHGSYSLFNVQNFIRGIRVTTNYLNASSLHHNTGPRDEIYHTITGFPSLQPQPTANNVTVTINGVSQTVQAYFAASM